MKMRVDTFFKIAKYCGFRESDDFDRTTNKRRSIRSLSLDEASDMFGFSPKEDLDLLLYSKQSLQEYIRGKYENKE